MTRTEHITKNQFGMGYLPQSLLWKSVISLDSVWLKLVTSAWTNHVEYMLELKKKKSCIAFSGMEKKINEVFFCLYIEYLWTTAKDQILNYLLLKTWWRRKREGRKTETQCSLHNHAEMKNLNVHFSPVWSCAALKNIGLMETNGLPIQPCHLVSLAEVK